MTDRKPVQSREELRAQMEAAAARLWDGVDIVVSAHLQTALRQASQSKEIAA